MKMVEPIVRGEPVGHVPEHEGGPTDSVGHPSDRASEVEVRLLRIFVGGVKSKHDVRKLAMAVWNIERDESGAPAAYKSRGPGWRNEEEPAVLNHVAKDRMAPLILDSPVGLAQTRIVGTRSNSL